MLCATPRHALLTPLPAKPLPLAPFGVISRALAPALAGDADNATVSNAATTTIVVEPLE